VSIQARTDFADPKSANVNVSQPDTLEISNSTNRSEVVAPHPPINRRRGRPL